MSPSELPQPVRCALHREQSNGRLWLVIGISLTGLCFTHATLAAATLPQGGTYVAGTGSIASQGNGLLITQPGSTRGVIDWNSFSIGRHNSVTFDNGAGATLNRVTGGSPSAILGRLSATGSLYVINPQGIVVGPSGVISTGGRFVASTLDVCNDAFTSGSSTLTLSGDSNAAVINLGRISSSGGDVFLIARDAVINAGTVSAPNGTAELATGGDVLLQDSASSRQVFVQTGSEGTVVNKGRISAAQVSLQAADGNVYALAGGGTRIRATGTASRDGHVWLVADSGRVDQLGKIAASNADGIGGTVDTQAAQLTFGKHAAVHAGQWNLSTPAFTIDTTAAHALRRSLNAGTSVDVTTTGANGATGDLGVASSLRWSGSASLTLAAYRNVSVTTGTTIANTGAGNLTLRADVSGVDNGGSVTNAGTIDWSKSTGIISALYDMKGTYTPGTLKTNAAWQPAGYSGLITQITPYQLVDSLADLNAVASNLAGNYALGRDIDASATKSSTYVPLGDYTTPFSGQFDGFGHQITGLYLSKTVNADNGNAGFGHDLQGWGLFGVIGATGVVRNLGLTANVDKYGASFPGYDALGLLVGVNYGKIFYVATSGANMQVGATSGYVAGLAGYNYGTIGRSSSSAAISVDGGGAGLVGYNLTGGLIDESFATGAVVGYGHTLGAGGLVAVNNGTITRSYETGSVTFNPAYCGGTSGNSTCDGGAAGLASINRGTISQSFATGLIQNTVQVSTRAPAPAGVATSNTGSIADNTYWNAQTSGTSTGVARGTAIPASNGLTTVQMSMPSSFVGFDFGPTGVWTMPAGVTHPSLRWQVAR